MDCKISLIPSHPAAAAQAITMVLAMAITILCGATVPALAQARPNIVVILTDDQDDMGSLDFMPSLQQLMVKEGVRFRNSFAEYPLCCPSRASLLSGQSAHNHNVLFNGPPVGGYGVFEPREEQSLGVWLQAEGYFTGILGKIMNFYGETGDPVHVMPGWHELVAVGPKRDQAYFDYTMNENGTTVAYGTAPSHYKTDVLTGKALSFIRKYAPKPRPFFLLVAPNAPHNHNGSNGMPVPAPRHDGDFATLDFEKPLNFNEGNVTDKPDFIASLPRLTGAQIGEANRRHRRRAETLQAVDDMVRKIVQELKAQGVLDQTYVIFTSDNGYSEGSHRWIGKTLPYQESLRVPLVIRGPGVPANAERNHLVTNLDLAATIIDIAGAAPTNALDGRSLIPLLADQTTPWRTAFGILGMVEVSETELMSYVGVRTRDYMYARQTSAKFGTDEEFYDLTIDPAELTNRLTVPRYAPVLHYLRNASDSLDDCVGTACWFTAQPPPPL